MGKRKSLEQGRVNGIRGGGMIKEIIRDIQKKENEIIKNMKNKAVLNVDMEINGKTWRKKTEYTKNSAGELEIKEFPVIILTGGTKW